MLVRFFSSLSGFCTVLFVSALLFCVSHKRRRFFVLRFVPCALLYPALPYLLPGSYTADYLTAGGWFMFSFPIFVILLAGILFLCFEIKPVNVVYYVTMAYTIQNMGYHLTNFIARLAHLDGALFYSLLSLGVNVLAVTLCYFTLIRKLRASFNTRGRRNVLLTGGIVLLIVYVFDMVVRAFGYANLATDAYSVLICAVLLIVQLGIFKQSRFEDDEVLLGELLRLQNKQRQLSEENLAVINVKVHDLRHQLAAMRDANRQGNALEEIEHSLGVYDSFIKSGSEVLDVILTEKGLICANKGIRTGFIVDGKGTDFVEPSDLWALFGNLLDNAIEAVEDLPPEKRIIRMNVSRQKGFLCIHEDNWCEKELIFENGLPKTTSKDDGFHGFGTLSIRMIAEKYGGRADVACEDKVFSVDVCLPLPKVKQAAHAAK